MTLLQTTKRSCISLLRRTGLSAPRRSFFSPTSSAEDVRIESIEVYALGSVHDWNFYSDVKPLRSSLTICRIRTSCGLEGVGGVTQYSEDDFDYTTATHLVNHFAPKLLGQNPFMREEIMSGFVSNVYPTAPLPCAAADIALWDLLGNASGMPLYMLLGGSRKSLPVQYSSPSFATIDEYLNWSLDALRLGCRRLKYHGFMNYKKDKELVKAVREYMPPDTYLALDVENRYSFQEALKMSKLLSQLDFDWFEAPLPDRDLEQYANLTRRSDIDILPGGNSGASHDLQTFADGCRRACWSRARFDVTACGGISNARKYFSIAESYGMQTEVQSWGHTLTAAANLHVMLGLGGGGRLSSSHFEVAVPQDIYELGMIDVLSHDTKGLVHVPNSVESHPGGLGVRVNWEEVKRNAYFMKHVGAVERLHVNGLHTSEVSVPSRSEQATNSLAHAL